MYCQNCSSRNEEQANFCSHCGSSLRSYVINNSSVSGDASFNAGQNNIITGNITVGTSGAKSVALIERTKVTPFVIAGHPIKVACVMASGALAGVLGVAGNIASILSVWPANPISQTSFMVVAIFGVLLFVAGFELRRKLFIRINSLINIESNRERRIYFTRIGGFCLKCDGKLKLRRVGEERNKTVILRCTRNPDHWHTFDPTVLGYV